MDHKQHLSHLLFICLLLAGSIPIALHVSSQNVSAAPDTHTWDGGGANALASTQENWVSDVTPEAGDSVIFNAGALPCTWDLSIALGSFSMSAGYTGTITQAASFSVTGYSQVAGTFTGSTSYILTCSGDFVRTGGTITDNVLRITMTGSGKVFNPTSSTTLHDVVFNDDTTVSSASGLQIYHSLTVASGKTITLTFVGSLSFKSWGGGVFSNSGTIGSTGADIFYLQLGGDTRSTAFGTINVPLTIHHIGVTHSDAKFNLAGNMIVGSTLTVSSSDATFNMTLDLTPSNYALSATDITLGTRGILMGRDSAITSSGNVDFSAGAFYGNTSKLIMTGTGKTIKTANTNGAPYDLTISGTVTTLSSLNVTNNLTIDAGKSLTMGSGMALTFGNLASAGSLSLQSDTYTLNPVINSGSIVQNGKRFNISGSSSTPLTGYGTFDGDLYLNGSSASNYRVQTGIPMGYLYTDRDTKINLDSTRYLEVVPASTEFVDVKISSIGTEQGYAARWTGTSTGPVTYTVTANANELYDIWVDHTTRIGVVQTSADGIVQFTYNGPFSTHEFTVSKSGGPPTNLAASFSYSISGNQVSFTDKSYGGVSTYLWDFGDGTGSTNQNPVHKYAKSGDYTISLTVYDSSGHSSTAKTTITLKLGPQFPVEPTPKGWNVWVSDKLTVSVSALALLIFGTWFLLAGYFPPLLPLMTPKTKKILGLIIIAIGLYWFVFVDNSHSWLGWGSV